MVTPIEGAAERDKATAPFAEGAWRRWGRKTPKLVGDPPNQDRNVP